MDRPEVNLVDADEPEDKQSGAGCKWQLIPEDMRELSLDSVEIRDATAAFRSFSSVPPVNTQATNIDFLATNISNIDGKGGELVATAEVTADLFAESPLSAKAEFSPMDVRNFMFALDADVKDLKKLNEFPRPTPNSISKRATGD